MLALSIVSISSHAENQPQDKKKKFDYRKRTLGMPKHMIRTHPNTFLPTVLLSNHLLQHTPSRAHDAGCAVYTAPLCTDTLPLE